MIWHLRERGLSNKGLELPKSAPRELARGLRSSIQCCADRVATTGFDEPSRDTKGVALH